MSERRWKIACINWGHDDAPHALAYVWDGSEMTFERYFPRWLDAIRFVGWKQYPIAQADDSEAAR